jgi:hypothetical protein
VKVEGAPAPVPRMDPSREFFPVTDDDLDLFGMPRPPVRGAGRPEYVWTEEKSNRVNLLFACGYKPEEVAPIMGCCLRTFRRVFARECQGWRNAKLKFRSTQMMRLNEQAKAGNVSAEKALAGMIQAEHVKAVAVNVQQRGKAEPKPPVLGKKAAASEAAKNLGGRFGTRKPPPALMN